MERYSIYCTQEQTRKAFKLGAPLQYGYLGQGVVYIEDEGYMRLPTAEQMLGWLEDQESIYEVYVSINPLGWFYSLYINDEVDVSSDERSFSSRKEATLAAIDAALEYLSNTKKD